MSGAFPNLLLIDYERSFEVVAGDVSGAVIAAEAWCAERRISVGRMQAKNPRGLMFGDVDIQKWRNLSAADRNLLHGVMCQLGDQISVRLRLAPLGFPSNEQPSSASYAGIQINAERLAAAFMLYRLTNTVKRQHGEGASRVPTAYIALGLAATLKAEASANMPKDCIKRVDEALISLSKSFSICVEAIANAAAHEERA